MVSLNSRNKLISIVVKHRILSNEERYGSDHTFIANSIATKQMSWLSNADLIRELEDIIGKLSVHDVGILSEIKIERDMDAILTDKVKE